ncbi:MAG: OmpA family protein, partial [Geminicoccaceae bacterium]
EQQLQGLRDELAAKNDAQRTLSEQAESVAATAAAQETKLGEVEASLDKQRKELLAARNDATSAQREAAEKDKQIQALANAGRELVASAEALEADKKSLSEQLATSNASTDGLQHEVQQGRSELLAVRNDLSSAERELAERDKQIAALTSAARELVAGNEALEADEASLADQLTTSRSDLQRLQGDLQAAKTELLAVRNDLSSAERELAERDKQIAALTSTGRELVAGGEELAATNLALEGRLAELTGPGEMFMKALAETLGPDSAVEAVDGRLVFPSDLAFAPGASNLSPAARAKALEYGRAIAAALSTLPDDSPWFLRVDGHTDRQRVGGRRFASNRELSAARALAVTNVLIEAGVPPERIAPTAFGEFRPVDPADTPEAYEANRRIELELDED